jgi:NhaP-type Na+/H+ or K+/H+ antiporter
VPRLSWALLIGAVVGLALFLLGLLFLLKVGRRRGSDRAPDQVSVPA